MKNFITIILCFIFSCTFAQTKVAEENQSSGFKEFKIDGMHCAGGCARYIQTELNRHPDIVALVDFANSKAIIEYNTNDLTDGDIINMINSYHGGQKFTASVMSLSNSKTCSKGANCCQKTGKINPSCDNKAKGCCASAKCNKKTAQR